MSGPLRTDPIPSFPKKAADIIPMRIGESLQIAPDESSEETGDGHEGLQISYNTGRLRPVEIFHVRMPKYGLTRREFSVRWYCRESGRELCHSKLSTKDTIQLEFSNYGKVYVKREWNKFRCTFHYWGKYYIWQLKGLKRLELSERVRVSSKQKNQKRVLKATPRLLVSISLGHEPGSRTKCRVPSGLMTMQDTCRDTDGLQE